MCCLAQLAKIYERAGCNQDENQIAKYILNILLHWNEYLRRQSFNDLKQKKYEQVRQQASIK
jgi:hypothetical protein